MMESKLKTENMFLDEEQAAQRFVKISHSFCGYRFNSDCSGLYGGWFSGLRREGW